MLVQEVIAGLSEVLENLGACPEPTNDKEVAWFEEGLTLGLGFVGFGVKYSALATREEKKKLAELTGKLLWFTDGFQSYCLRKKEEAEAKARETQIGFKL